MASKIKSAINRLVETSNEEYTREHPLFDSFKSREEEPRTCNFEIGVPKYEEMIEKIKDKEILRSLQIVYMKNNVHDPHYELGITPLQIDEYTWHVVCANPESFKSSEPIDRQAEARVPRTRPGRSRRGGRKRYRKSKKRRSHRLRR